METEKNNHLAKNPMLLPYIIFLGIISSTILYIIILKIKFGVLVPSPVSFQEAMNSPLFIPLSFSAFVALFISYTIPNMVLKSIIKQKKKMGLILAGKPISDVEIVQIYLTKFIIILAMRESIAIFGFVGGILTSSFDLATPFFALSLVGMLLTWPSLEKWRNQIITVE